MKEEEEEEEEEEKERKKKERRRKEKRKKRMEKFTMPWKKSYEEKTEKKFIYWNK